MYKLLIVDDEEMIREGISKGISWNDLGFDVVGEACNGLEALEALKRCVPDVIITDIRMPEMDGIELMEILAESYPSVKMVVLSGYNDFEYLKSSIRNNVFDYLLKPTLISEFIELFKKLKLVIDNEKQKEKEYEDLKQSLIENLPYLEQIFLNHLVSGFYHNRHEIEEKKAFYKLNMLEGRLAAIILEIDNLQNISKEISEEKLQLLKLFVLKAAEKNVIDTVPGKFFIGNDGSIIGICCINAGLKNLLQVLKEMQQYLFQYKKLNISAGISNEFSDLLEINTCLNQARQAIKQKLCLGSQSIIFYNDIENISDESIPTINFEVGKITDLIFAGQREEISDYILTTLNCLKNRILKSFDFVDSSIMKLLFELDSCFYQYGISIRKTMEERGINFQEICHADTLDQKAAWLFSLLIDISEIINSKRSDKVTRIIAEVTRYLDRNFTSNSICLESVAEMFKKSPPYLSKLFKEELGENFTDYLAKLRMEKAKELLRDVKIKVYEVPAMVGYADISHFSRKFKSYTGVSPAQFRSEYVSIGVIMRGN